MDTGRDPKTAIRYRYRAGERWRYRLHRVSWRPDGLAPPRHEHLLLAWTVDRTQGTRAQGRWDVLRAGPTGLRIPGARPATLWVQVSALGRIEAVRIPGAPTHQRESLRSLLRGVQVRFPKEAVGAGASWRQRQTLRLPPVSGRAIGASLNVTYRLERFERCGQSRCVVVDMAARIEASSRAGWLRVSSSGAGSGTLRFDVGAGRLLQSTSRLRWRIEARMGAMQAAEEHGLRTRLESVGPAPLRDPGPRN